MVGPWGLMHVPRDSQADWEETELPPTLHVNADVQDEAEDENVTLPEQRETREGPREGSTVVVDAGHGTTGALGLRRLSANVVETVV